MARKRAARVSLLEATPEMVDGHQGLINLAFIVLVLVCATRIVGRVVETGAPLDLLLLRCLSHDLFLGLGIVIASVALATTAFALHKLFAAARLGVRCAWTLYGALLGLLVLLPAIAVLEADLAPMSSLLVGVAYCILIMKTHSYFVVNMELAEARPKKDDNDDNTSPKQQHSKKTEASSQQQQQQQPQLVYPANLTLVNWLDFLTVPTLVYDIDAPRTQTVRKWYVVREFVCGTGCLLCFYVGVVDFIWPVLLERRTGLLWTLWKLLRLCVPTILAWLIAFYALDRKSVV